jgi:hypothetical protein
VILIMKHAGLRVRQSSRWRGGSKSSPARQFVQLGIGANPADWEGRSRRELCRRSRSHATKVWGSKPLEGLEGASGMAKISFISEKCTGTYFAA